jgi:hypothetical protein
MAVWGSGPRGGRWKLWGLELQAEEKNEREEGRDARGIREGAMHGAPLMGKGFGSLAPF